MDQQIEAVFESGVFRPLQPVQLAERQRVTLFLSGSENGMDATELEMDQEIGYKPLPLQHCQTIRVNFRNAGSFAPIPYAIEDDDADALNELEQP